MAQAVILLAGEVGVEGIGFDEIRAGLEILPADVPNDLGLGQGEKIVIALEVALMIAEALAAKIILSQLEALDHHAPGAVEQQKPLSRFLLHPGETGGAIETHDKSFGLNPKQAASRIAEIGLVEGVEMELIEPKAAQLLHLIGQYGGSDDAAAFHIFIQPVIGAGEPVGDGCAGLGGHAFDAAESRGRHDAGHHRNGNAGLDRIVAKSRRRVIVEAELAQRAVGARLHLCLQQFDVMAMAGRIGMPLGIEGDADLERRDAANAGNQFGRGAITISMRTIRPAPCPACRRAAPRCGGCRHPNSPARCHRSRLSKRRRRSDARRA